MNLDDVYDGISFEDYVQLLFSSEDIEATTTPTSNDYGADLIVKHNGLTFSVQCKYYSNPVGIKAVQEVMGSLNYYDADYGVVITNSVFTQQARNLAHTNRILLIDGVDLNGSLKQLLEGFAKERKPGRKGTHRYSNDWTIEDLMIRYGVGRGSIMKNYLGNGLPYEKVGREYRFSEEAVKEWEVSQRYSWFGSGLPENIEYVRQKEEELEQAKANKDRKTAALIKEELRKCDPRYRYRTEVNAPLAWTMLGIFVVFVIIGTICFFIFFNK